MVKLFQFLTIVLSAICLVPAGAHLTELPAKIGLSREAYLGVQQIYSGWALFGAAIAAAILAGGVLSFLVREQGWPLLLAVAGTVLIAATLVTFFLFIEPANRATENWATLPDNWQQLRQQWEYTHAINAIVMLLGFAAFVLSALAWHD